MLAVDVSHWSGNITQVESITRQQLQTAVDGDLSVDAYVVLYWDGDIESPVRAALSTVSGLPIGRLWLDVEVYPAGRSVAQLENLIQEALDACGEMSWRHLHRQVVVGRLHAGLDAVLARVPVVRVVRQRRES